jgi:hypothetical protein
VLRLRAGVGIAHTRSRAEVVRITGLSRARVVAIERSGVRRLSALAGAGSCASAPGTAATSVDGPGAAATNVDGPGAAAARRPSASADLRPSPHIAVLGERDSNSEPAPPPESSSRDGRPFLHAPDSAIDLAPIVLAVGLAALLFALIREARRSA